MTVPGLPDTAGARRLRWLPLGTSPVAAGLVVNGVCTYLFLSLPARSGQLDPAEYGVVSALWFAAYLVGPGLFLPLEQELARRVADARARGTDARDPVLRALRFVGAATAMVGLVGAVAVAPVADAVFAGNRAAVGVLVAAVGGTGLMQWAKGWLAGAGAFSRYGALVAAEGVGRAGWVVAAVVVGAQGATPYLVPVALAPVLAVVVSLARWPGRTASGADERGAGSPIAGAIGTLVVAQTGAQFLMNGVPLAAALLATSADQDLVGRLGAAVVLARTPLFLFQAIQAALLPGLATSLAEGDHDGFRSALTRVAVALSGLGALAVAGGAALGPWTTALLFGADFDVSATVFAALVASAILIVLALVVAQALVALDAHRLVALGWVVGALAFVVAVVPPSDLAARVTVAGVVGPAVALVALAACLRSRLP